VQQRETRSVRRLVPQSSHSRSLSLASDALQSHADATEAGSEVVSPQAGTQSHRAAPGAFTPARLQTNGVDEQSSSSSSSSSTMTRDSAGNASEEANKDSTTGGSSSEKVEEKAADSGKPVTKDVLALRSLDAYFDKLDGPKRGEWQFPSRSTVLREALLAEKG